MTDKTGGAAFPVPATELHGTNTGMSLRDYFAAKCMPAIINSLNGPVVFEECKGDFDVYAKQAYVMADAMLKARG
ncbi:hypothetical protein [Proteus mirabilis]|uniref:hypothetical protein n=1 Tax=Proteus mirabilis TaxID=584 RepID=UPI001231BA23|nr:hypothetical protein [Proteus mirabilis]QEQ98824.1 hypothetical protein EHZ20_01870 [Proteus mirabilis]QQT51359.1 hypothetical protein I6I36_16375 [Proteus mirabilis]HCT3367408.1 hypothetical protein [Proteus mirabilis]